MKIFISTLLILPHLLYAEIVMKCTPVTHAFFISEVQFIKEEEAFISRTISTEGRITEAEVNITEWTSEEINIAAPVEDVVNLYKLKKFDEQWFFSAENINGNIIYKKATCITSHNL